MSFKSLLFISFLLSSTFGFSQDRLEGTMDTTQQTYAKNNIYLELAGKGLFYSINYERSLFNIGEKTSVRANIGFCIFPGLTKVRKSNDFLMSFSISIQQHLKKNHFISFGVGSTYYNYLINDIPITNANLHLQPLTAKLKPITEWFGHINLEYRFQKPKGGLMYKAGVTPLFFDKMQNFTGMKTAQFSANIGIGYTF